MSSSEFTKSIIAMACWRAARQETYQVMLSVCMVFKNRAAVGWFYGDLYENCAEWLVENHGPFPDPRDPVFLNLLSRLDSVIEGKIADKTDGALYFARKSDCEAITGQITCTMGQMNFIR